MSTESLASEQAGVLRALLRRRFLIALLAWVVVFAGLSAFMEQNVVKGLANDIADATAQWVYVDANSFDSVAARADNLQVVPGGDGQVAIRDLSIYNLVRDLKVPVAVGVFALGVVAIGLWSTRSALAYFDALMGAVSEPAFVEGGPLTLPPELSLASRQLEDLQARFEDSRQVAIMAEQRKNELVAYLAHDIRSPLTSVIGYVSLLSESPDLPREKRAEYAGLALAKAERLEELIEEFFEITRYNLNSIPIEREQVDVALFLGQVADEFGTVAQSKGVEVAVSAPEGVHAFIDPSKMARAVGNVLSNAIAYANPRSQVELAAKLAGGSLEVTCANVGKEISSVHLERIFERFYREDGARGQGKGNAGLGLAIAREIVEAHGGSISAASEGGTTTFTVCVPAQ